MFRDSEWNKYFLLPTVFFQFQFEENWTNCHHTCISPRGVHLARWQPKGRTSQFAKQAYSVNLRSNTKYGLKSSFNFELAVQDHITCGPTPFWFSKIKLLDNSSHFLAQAGQWKIYSSPIFVDLLKPRLHPFLQCKLTYCIEIPSNDKWQNNLHKLANHPCPYWLDSTW